MRIWCIKIGIVLISYSYKVQLSDSLFSYFSIDLRKTRRCLWEKANTESLIQAIFLGKKNLIGGINEINSHFGVFLSFLPLLKNMQLNFRESIIADKYLNLGIF
jgi:hypothetical protein